MAKTTFIYQHKLFCNICVTRDITGESTVTKYGKEMFSTEEVQSFRARERYTAARTAWKRLKKG